MNVDVDDNEDSVASVATTDVVVKVSNGIVSLVDVQCEQTSKTVAVVVNVVE